MRAMPYLRLALAAPIVAAIAAGAAHAKTQVATPASTPPAGPEQKYLEADPVLYAAARQYFPSDDAAVAPKRLFRLTRDQLDTTVSTLLPRYVTQSVKDAVPKDALQTNYEYAEILSFNPANTRGLSAWIGGIAARVRADPAGVITCAADATDCLKAEARGFIIKAFRGDVSDEKINKLTAFYLAGVQAAGLNQATGDLVEVVLNSPDFLFRKEIDVTRNARLMPAQLLQAVTFTAADAPPENVGLQSQRADQYLRTGKEAATTIGAIVASKEAREKLMRFFTAWLEIKDPGEFTISQKVFPEFDAKLAAAMRAETKQFLRAQLSKPAPKLKDITQATQSFVPKTLSPLYGSQTATSSGAALVDLDPAQRLGIFSQPGVIASHSGPTDSRPIKRGVFWVRKAMCMELEPPPKDLHAKLYEMTGATERQRIEQSTNQPACAGCHKVINPFAFFQESYDALGRWRTRDNGSPIDTSILINFLDEEPVKTTSTVEALKTLTNSMMFKQCFVRQLFRFYMGRNEEASDDPLLRRMFFEFAYNDDQDILRALQTLTSSERIVKRQ
jgi:Protein of unknown function (DUF1588)/Protein of unknown function (DUF1592)/Protein of unknown function (DUF1595)